MEPDQHLILTGFMGSGKSSVGRELAALLQRPFIDLDEYIEQQVGLSIAELFSQKGEPAFRRLEQQYLEKIMTTSSVPLVLATGGGTIISKKNRDLLHHHGYIVFLNACEKTIMQRTLASRARPLLLAEGSENIGQRQFRRQKIKDLLDERRPFYECCQLSISTDNLSVHQIAARIIQQLR